VALIKSDHRKVDKLFKEFEAAGERAYKTKQRLVERIIAELDAHAVVEEELLYPAVEAKAAKDGKKMVHEAEEEHHVVKILLGALASMSPQDEHYDAKVTVLIENVRHHVEEEESEMLPQAEKLLGKSSVQELGGRIAARKQQLLDQGR
jgi:hemerythrin superfamily protein